MAKKKSAGESNHPASAARVAAKLQASSVPASPSPAHTATTASGSAKGQSAAARTPTLPRRWNPWRTSVVLLLLIAILGVVPVALGGEILGWWQPSQLLPLFHLR